MMSCTLLAVSIDTSITTAASHRRRRTSRQIDAEASLEEKVHTSTEVVLIITTISAA